MRELSSEYSVSLLQISKRKQFAILVSEKTVRGGSTYNRFDESGARIKPPFDVTTLTRRRDVRGLKKES
jgi:hypothetical protein